MNCPGCISIACSRLETVLTSHIVVVTPWLFWYSWYKQLFEKSFRTVLILGHMCIFSYFKQSLKLSSSISMNLVEKVKSYTKNYPNNKICGSTCFDPWIWQWFSCLYQSFCAQCHCQLVMEYTHDHQRSFLGQHMANELWKISLFC